MMLQAGKDKYVETEGQDYVCEKAKDCIKVVFPNSEHEIWNEADKYRDVAMGQVFNFILGSSYY